MTIKNIHALIIVVKFLANNIVFSCYPPQARKQILILSSSINKLEYIAATQHKRIRAMLVSYKNIALMKSDAQLSSLILSGKLESLGERKQDIDRIFKFYCAFNITGIVCRGVQLR